MSMVDSGNRSESSSHAARMDGIYRYQRHIYDLTRKYYLLGRDRAIRDLAVPDGGSLLEVGCGTGRNLLLAERLYPRARLYGLDISQEMLAQAARNFRGRPAQPHLIAADATAFTAEAFGVSGFDRILISYALSMIPDWEKSVSTALAALNPGGVLHIVDFGQQERLPEEFRSLLQTWLARFHVTPRANLESVLMAKARDAEADLTFERLYRGYAWAAALRKKP
ncbi:class I SAM-dependent methyltransferase [Rhizobium paknamense]|uniref:S-adenosylmethionine-diacylgycerolhomoserine-N-methyltransferase n=1 Tax=Rhizobium paknamense TaxID=1206817 RepID=A0ABU0IBB0_9HYPH|nr:class I SAM-dependent methyltransferase [Rhizobium paknamense]MDQ0454775.1 S-adenosylmethionine-diacylgycerolhomoserine-N-methyltransferase [Rhizobium paknamense]